MHFTHPSITPAETAQLTSALLQCGNCVLRSHGHPANIGTLDSLVAAFVAIGQAEIIAYFRDGTVPWDTPDFTTLHEHVDANCYALLCDENWAWPSDFEDNDPDGDIKVQCTCDLGNAVQGTLASWLRETLPLRKAFAETIAAMQNEATDRAQERDLTD